MPQSHPKGIQGASRKMTASRVRPFVFFAIAIGIAVGLFLAEPALAGAPALDGEKLFEERTCLTCHGVDAKTPILPEYPKLAGQNAAYMVQQVEKRTSRAELATMARRQACAACCTWSTTRRSWPSRTTSPSSSPSPRATASSTQEPQSSQEGKSS